MSWKATPTLFLSIELMILPDVNVLVHAHNADSAVHDVARIWWDKCLSGPEGVGLAWAAMLGFVRITTNRKVVARPISVPAVMTWIDGWLALPHVHIVQPSDSHFARLRKELEDARLKNELLNAMIDIAEGQMGIDIRKKRGARR